jgi:hypothetical protein
MKRILLFMMAFIAYISINAQGVTTASVTGKITDSKGEELIGATVTALHVPSGSLYGNTTNSDGRFAIPGLRVGGPYKISASYVGFQDFFVENVYLNLGQDFVFNTMLTEEGVLIDEVVITSARNSILNSKKNGTGTNIGSQAINSLPTLSRSISDFTRLTPQANGRSFSGTDARFNNITLDGSIFNNSFGLSDIPGGQTNSTPFSLDAVEQIQVNIAPFDVRQGGFTGAGVNVVTKSGTNEFSGSIFANTRNESYVGDKAGERDVVTQNFDIKQYGFRLGGPIIKNKLFFFANAELERRTDPATQFTALRDGQTVGGTISRVRASDLDRLRETLISRFNYDPGAYEGFDFATQSDKATLKLDYNMDSKNRLSVRYNYLKSSRDVEASASGAFSGRTNNGFSLGFENSNYVINNDIHSIIAEHNYLGKGFTNKIIGGFTANRDYRSSKGGIFPLVDILEAGRNYTAFGYEPFTPNNILNTDTWQLQNNFTYYMKNHTITAGINFEAFEFRNTFTPTYYGQFVYSSLQDFYNDIDTDQNNNPTLRRYVKTSSNLAGGALPTATTRARQIGFYIQDEISVGENLKLTAGVRADVPSFDNTALENKEVNEFTFQDEFGKPLKVNTAQLPKTNILISPRIGFNYKAKGDRSIQIRGGTGFFTGRPAFVWLSNQVGNNGILTGSVNEDNTKNKYNFSPDVNKYNTTPNPGGPAPSYGLAMVDPDFRFPQVWRSNLAVDVQLPLNIVATGEFLYNKDINNVTYINANLKASSANLVGPDTRPIYGYNNAGNRLVQKVTDVTTLKNTDQGQGYSATFKLERLANDGLTAMAAYTYSQTKDLMSAGSIAFSSWRDNSSVRGNNLPDLAFSNNDLTHRIIANLGYSFEWIKALNTSFNLFYQNQNQGRISYRINGDLNGDQLVSNDLLFIPNKASDLRFQQYVSGGVTYTIAQQEAAFDQFINNDEYLSSRRGQYAERNGKLMPMISSLDFSFSQEIFATLGGKRNKLQLRADIFNFGNLLNSDWGVSNAVINATPLRFVTRTAGVPVYEFSNRGTTLPTQTLEKRASLGDVWQAQLGVRYTFN